VAGRLWPGKLNERPTRTTTDARLPGRLCNPASPPPWLSCRRSMAGGMRDLQEAGVCALHVLERVGDIGQLRLLQILTSLFVAV